MSGFLPTCVGRQVKAGYVSFQWKQLPFEELAFITERGMVRREEWEEEEVGRFNQGDVLKEVGFGLCLPGKGEELGRRRELGFWP